MIFVYQNGEQYYTFSKKTKDGTKIWDLTYDNIFIYVIRLKKSKQMNNDFKYETLESARKVHIRLD